MLDSVQLRQTLGGATSPVGDRKKSTGESPVLVLLLDQHKPAMGDICKWGGVGEHRAPVVSSDTIVVRT